ncbi:MAG TPA: peptidoglycan bridge formation glycyltransferase FemA/FemB family protein [Anaerolineales bacterium]|nr:peptidoglycan bridge formation glycyltransferase FemA/FemB family protein [Anaerolineales bacterium]
MALQRRLVTDAYAWDKALLSLPEPHILQSWVWGELKSRYGWRAERWLWETDGQPRAAAQVLERSWPTSFGRRAWRLLYIPRGPIVDPSEPSLTKAVLAELADIAREHQAVFLKIDPEIAEAVADPAEAEPAPAADGSRLRAQMLALGWIPSPEQVQFRSTLRLDLRQDEQRLLERMKPKTRYNVRLAERRDVTVRPAGSADLDVLYAMYAETSVRDRFVIRPKDYYLDAWGLPLSAGRAQAFLAEVAGQPVAGLILFHFGSTAWYFYGMSRSAHRDRMPTHLLQWEAVRWAKGRGFTTYDFWGAPDRPDPQDPMFGVFRFKAGFGASFVRTLGAWDLPVRPAAHRLYAFVLPRVLGILRIGQRRRTRNDVEEAASR